MQFPAIIILQSSPFGSFAKELKDFIVEYGVRYLSRRFSVIILLHKRQSKSRRFFTVAIFSLKALVQRHIDCSVSSTVCHPFLNLQNHHKTVVLVNLLSQCKRSRKQFCSGESESESCHSSSACIILHSFCRDDNSEAAFVPLEILTASEL